MDIQADKLSLIEWIAGTDDTRIIQQIKSIQLSNEKNTSTTLSQAEKKAIDEGLESIAKGHVHTNESVVEYIKKKFPNLHK